MRRITNKKAETKNCFMMTFLVVLNRNKRITIFQRSLNCMLNFETAEFQREIIRTVLFRKQ